MTLSDKLDMVKSVLGVADDTMNERLTTYLTISGREIIAWRFQLAPTDTAPDDVPADYEMTQVMAVVAGFSQAGAEGETMHQENGFIHRFSYPDMLHYIHANVLPIVRVI